MPRVRRSWNRSETAIASAPIENRLLTALPPEALELLRPLLHLEHLPLGALLYDSDQVVRHAYFPTTSIVSLHYVMRDGHSAEVAGVGNEGMVGVALLLGGNRATSRAMVQTAGQALRLDAPALDRALAQIPAFRRLLFRYVQALLAQMTQTIACTRHHSIEQQLCRWILLTLDRMPARELVMTQDLIATMLGVRRESVTDAARELKDRGIVDYHRGHIKVIDRDALNTRVCECYGVVKTEFDRLLRDAHDHGDGS